MISVQDMIAKQKGMSKPAKPASKPAPPKNKPVKSIADIMREHHKARPVNAVPQPATKPKATLSIQDMIAKQASVNRSGNGSLPVNITAALSSDEERAIYADFELFCKEIDKIASEERAKMEAQRAAKAAAVKPVATAEPEVVAEVAGVPDAIVEEAVAAFVEESDIGLLGGISLGSEETGAEQTMVVAKTKKRRKK